MSIDINNNLRCNIAVVKFASNEGKMTFHRDAGTHDRLHHDPISHSVTLSWWSAKLVFAFTRLGSKTSKFGKSLDWLGQGSNPWTPTWKANQCPYWIDSNVQARHRVQLTVFATGVCHGCHCMYEAMTFNEEHLLTLEQLITDLHHASQLLNIDLIKKKTTPGIVLTYFSYPTMHIYILLYYWCMVPPISGMRR